MSHFVSGHVFELKITFEVLKFKNILLKEIQRGKCFHFINFLCNFKDIEEVVCGESFWTGIPFAVIWHAKKCIIFCGIQHLHVHLTWTCSFFVIIVIALLCTTRRHFILTTTVNDVNDVELSIDVHDHDHRRACKNYFKDFLRFTRDAHVQNIHNGYIYREIHSTGYCWVGIFVFIERISSPIIYSIFAIRWRQTGHVNSEPTF